uniref:SFRICE_022271 n=1 Tax=Spodoptera frugiperda TaxID=7108 RepID=A0A2H1W9R6_SPOFR
MNELPRWSSGRNCDVKGSRVRFPGRVKRQEYVLCQSQSQNYLFQIDQEGTFERQSKYNNINNVCLSVSPLVKLFAHSKLDHDSHSKSSTLTSPHQLLARTARPLSAFSQHPRECFPTVFAALRNASQGDGP